MTYLDYVDTIALTIAVGALLCWQRILRNKLAESEAWLFHSQKGIERAVEDLECAQRCLRQARPSEAGIIVDSTLADLRLRKLK